MRPTNTDLSDWTFEELRDYCAWSVIQGLLGGVDLATRMHLICDLSVRWGEAQDEKTAKRNVKRRKGKVNI